MTYRVVFAPEAVAQMETLFRYIAQAAGAVIGVYYGGQDCEPVLQWDDDAIK